MFFEKALPVSLGALLADYGQLWRRRSVATEHEPPVAILEWKKNVLALLFGCFDPNTIPVDRAIAGLRSNGLSTHS